MRKEQLNPEFQVASVRISSGGGDGGGGSSCGG